MCYVERRLASTFHVDHVVGVYTSKHLMVDDCEIRSCAIFRSVSMISPVARRFAAEDAL